ncbi:SRPBCC family protein [Agromyces sp. NPDC056523]|uniref:SRPBCC family protein n=1 Tax=Agromyces sp. NPDC056523 TaxID=3345850 RepID=UPI0036721FC8
MASRVAASNSITIARPIDVVFAFFAEAENDPTWRQGVRSIERDGGGVPRLGAVYRQRVDGAGGREIPADIEVTAFEPPRRVAFRGIAGPVRPLGEYRFEPDGSGTRVHFSLEAELGWFMALFLSKRVQHAMDAEVDGLTRAKAQLERS